MNTLNRLLFLLVFFLSQNLLAANNQTAYDMMRPATENYNSALQHKKQAIEHEQRALREKSKFARSSLKNKAQKQYKLAIEQYKIAIVKKSDFYQAYNGLGQAYKGIGNYQESLTAFNKAISKRPNYPEAIEQRAEVYLQLQQFKRVKAAYNLLATKFHPDYAEQLLKTINTWAKEIDNQAEKLSGEKRLAFSNWIQQQLTASGNVVSQR